MLRKRIRLIGRLPFERSRHGYLSGWWLRRLPGLLGAVWPLQNIGRGWYSGCCLPRVRRECGKPLWWLQDRRRSTRWPGRRLRSSCLGDLSSLRCCWGLNEGLRGCWRPSWPGRGDLLRRWLRTSMVRSGTWDWSRWLCGRTGGTISLTGSLLRIAAGRRNT